MFKIKLSLLLIAIFILNVDFLLSYPVFAAQDTMNSNGALTFDAFKRHQFSHASNPDCSAFFTGAVSSVLAVLVGVVTLGIFTIIGSGGILVPVVVMGIVTAFLTAWNTVGAFFTCSHSFVTHPVAYDDSGEKYKDFGLRDPRYNICANKYHETEEEYQECLREKLDIEDMDILLDTGISTDISTDRKIDEESDDWQKNGVPDNYYWPKNSVQHSEYIEVCHRQSFVFSNLLDSKEKDKFHPRERTINDERSWYEVNIMKDPWKRLAGELECKRMKAGTTKEIHGITFQAVRKASKLCVELKKIPGTFVIVPGGRNIGCVDIRPDPLVPMCRHSKIIFRNNKESIAVDDLPGRDYRSYIIDQEKKGFIFEGYDNEGCFEGYVSKACYNQGVNSLSLFSVTSIVVQCIKESLDRLVKGTKDNPDSFLLVAQRRLKNTVTAVLILALMFFAIKVISGGVRSPQETYILIIKFAFVMYFTAGNGMQKYYDNLIMFSNGAQNIVLSTASSSQGICEFKSDYYTGDHLYLAPWDKLDCRIAFYLGAPLKGIANKFKSAENMSGKLEAIGATVLVGLFVIFMLMGNIIFIILFGGPMLIAIIATFMGILMLCVVLWACYVFILSLVALSVVVIISPIFIPMILFQHTKGYFDGWVKELITYSLYPVILFAFLSFMFISCDKVFFNGLEFKMEKITTDTGAHKYWPELKHENMCNDNSALACVLQNIRWKDIGTKNPLLGALGLVGISAFKENTDVLHGLVKMALILFLFYHFLNILPAMAAELSGNYRAQLGSGSTPGQLTKQAISYGRMVAGDATEMAKTAAKTAAKMAFNKARSAIGGGSNGSDSDDK